jgi:hypothetical protein
MPHGASTTGDTNIILIQESLQRNCNDAFCTMNAKSFISLNHFYKLQSHLGPYFKTGMTSSSLGLINGCLSDRYPELQAHTTSWTVD